MQTVLLSDAEKGAYLETHWVYLTDWKLGKLKVVDLELMLGLSRGLCSESMLVGLKVRLKVLLMVELKDLRLVQSKEYMRVHLMVWLRDPTKDKQMDVLKE